MTRLTATDLITSVKTAIGLTAEFATPLNSSSPLRRVYDQFSIASSGNTLDPVKPLKAAVRELNYLHQGIQTLQADKPDHPNVKAYNTFRDALAKFDCLSI